MRPAAVLALLALPAAVFCMCPKLSLPYGASEFTIPRPEGNRRVKLYVPRSLNVSAPAPVILFFHGWTETCDSLPCSDKSCYWDSEAEARGFISAIPCGYGGSWNAGQCCSPANAMKLDDTLLARTIVQYIQNRSCVDRDRVFSTGFSNGAMLTELLLCEASDVFSAGASAAGIVEYSPGEEKALDKCNQKYNATVGRRPTRLLTVHGTADIVVPWEGDPVFGYVCVHEGNHNKQLCNMQGWLDRNGCNSNNKTHFFKKGDFEAYGWPECATGGTFEFVKWHNGPHAYPIKADFNATAYFTSWLFNVSK